MPSTKPRILIPGGAGYIGSHVALVTLLTRKYRVTGKHLIPLINVAQDDDGVVC